ncbi:isoprenylcysteine carboxyl methyltransferase family protein [Gephyromycinifex aptenodytis]|uniref:isoprenylcysteine carboxyl methyltransferase family protein n=1 Tax=Gephyromycinifex aptenodytis TaxID=2716227 RepID=UPI001445F421|nr:isoprenylcysteine carboxyl methyltransferase family protein [Gephyromycinifex aptenodytis]
MNSAAWFTVLIVLVGLERVAELILSRRNAAWALARGGQEYGRQHYPAMVALHSGFLLAALIEVWFLGRAFPWWGWCMLVLVVAAQALRWWCIATLGRRWNTRVIVVPGLPLIERGPYGVLRHPNYVAVVLEGFALPLVHGAWITALVFSTCNAALLRRRIQVENAALAQAPAARVDTSALEVDQSEDQE